MSQKSPPIKINGVSRGLNLHQVSCYVVLATSIFFFSYVIVPNFITSVQVTLSFLYYLSTCAMIFFGFWATVIDPTDEAVIDERRCKREGKPFDGSAYMFQCDYCQTSVHEDSKHCRTCDRCVNDFDHHCNWINNCVSKKNYRHFFSAIVSLALSTTFFMLAGLLFTIDYFTENIGLIEDLQDMKVTNKHEWKPIIMSVLTGVSFVFWVLVVKLIFFHIYLMRNELTTYEYIIEKKQLEKSKESNKKPMKKKNRKILPFSFSSGKSVNNKDLEIQTQKPPSGADDGGFEDDHQTSDRHSIPDMRRSVKSNTNTRRGSRTGLSDANLTVERDNIKYLTKGIKSSNDGVFDNNGHHIISGSSSPNFIHKNDQYTFGGERVRPDGADEDDSPKLMLGGGQRKMKSILPDVISPFGSQSNLKHFDSVETPLTISKNTSTFLLEKNNKLKKDPLKIPIYEKETKTDIEGPLFQSCPETEERYLKRNTEAEIADIIANRAKTDADDS